MKRIATLSASTMVPPGPPSAPKPSPSPKAGASPPFTLKPAVKTKTDLPPTNLLMTATKTAHLPPAEVRNRSKTAAAKKATRKTKKATK
jgi:hypothetical protein